MGIRFLCPQGHRLNVKAFQAGKRGVCPHCGAKFTVPSQSTLPTSQDEEIEQHLETTPASPETKESSVIAVDPPVDATDPLTEAPDASWYLAPPEGGRLGPANAAQMRMWLAEGRVTRNSLVWREGWGDWAVASTVFPRLASDAPEPPVPPPIAFEQTEAPMIGVLEAGRPSDASAARRARRLVDQRRRATRKKSVRMVGLLVVLVVVLAAVFIWVMKRS